MLLCKAMCYWESRVSQLQEQLGVKGPTVKSFSWPQDQNQQPPDHKHSILTHWITHHPLKKEACSSLRCLEQINKTVTGSNVLKQTTYTTAYIWTKGRLKYLIIISGISQEMCRWDNGSEILKWKRQAHEHVQGPTPRIACLLTPPSTQRWFKLSSRSCRGLQKPIRRCWSTGTEEQGSCCVISWSRIILPNKDAKLGLSTSSLHLS